jgi:uncharacterized membrane protein
MNMKLPIFGIMILVLALFSGAEMTDFAVESSGLPGDLIEGSFTLENTEGYNLTDITFSLSVPGFSSLDEIFSPSDIDELVDGSSVPVSFEFTIPSGQAVGDYTGTVTVLDGIPNDRSVVYTNDFTITVNELNSLSLDQSSGSLSLEQEQTGTVQITITNNGNTDLTDVILSYDQADFEDIGNHEILLSFDDNSFDLDSGDYKIVTMTATTDDNQYLGDLNGDISIISSEGVTVSYDLTVTTFTNLISIDFDEVTDLDDLKPGDDFEFEVLVESLGFDMEDVKIEVWVLDILDNKKDLNDESNTFDLEQGDTEDKNFEFDVPYNVDEKSYSVRVRVDGEEDGNSSNDFTFNIVYENAVEVVKEDGEDIRLDDLSISSGQLTCGFVFTTYIDVINTGSDDLDDMYVKLLIGDLGLEYTSETFTLEEDDYDDREKDLQFVVTLPSDLDKDSYQLEFWAYNEDDETIVSKLHTIDVTSCEGSPDDDGDDGDDTGDVTPGSGNVVYLPTGFSIGDFFDADGSKTLFWVLGNIALLIVIVYFVVLIFKKKKLA